MATKTKPAPKTKPTETDDEVLARSFLYDDGEFEKLRRTGGNDAQLLVAIRQRWRMAPVQGGPGTRHYSVAVNDVRWGTAIWFDNGRDNDEHPDLSYRESTDGKKLRSDLLDAVRRVMQIPNVNETPAESPKKGKGKSADAPMGVKLGPVEKRPLSWFYDSPWQERAEHDQKWIDEQVESIKRFGQLEPVVARPDGQLISGHSRKMYVSLAGLKELDVRIAEVDDLTAQALVLIYNIDRRDLKLRERSRHYNRLLENFTARGMGLAEMAAELKKDKSTLSNEIRLSSLPDALWKRQEAGGLTIEQARRLAVHAAREPFVAGFVGYLKTIGFAENVQPTPEHFEKALAKAIERAFRPMTKDQFGEGCQFKPTAAQKKELDLVEVERFGGKETMAANVKLWTELNAAAVAVAEIKASETAIESGAEETSLPAASVTVSSNVEKEEAKQRRAEAVLHAWSLAYADSISQRFMGKRKRQDLPTILRLVALVQREVHGFNLSFRVPLDQLLGSEDELMETGADLIVGFFDPQEQNNGWTNLEWGELLKLADWLEVSPVKYWRPTRILLETCTDKELGNFLKELQLLPSDREANIEQLLNDWKVGQVPNAFVLKRGKA